MANAPIFKFQLFDDGVYRVTYEDLLNAGFNGDEIISTDSLSLSNQGQDVPIWIETGGDSRFGPGDWLEFVGEHLSGEDSHYHEYSPFNVYILNTRYANTTRRFNKPLRQPLPNAHAVTPYLSHQHLERDLLRVPLNVASGNPAQELWYWQKLAHFSSSPLRYEIDLADLQLQSDIPVSLRLQFRGWSDAATSMALPMTDHQVEIALNGVTIGRGEWNDQQVFLLNIPHVPKQSLTPGTNLIEIRVPSRIPAGQQDPLIDVVYLDWIEIDYLRTAVVNRAQSRIMLHKSNIGDVLRLITDQGIGAEAEPLSNLIIYDPDGYRVASDHIRISDFNEHQQRYHDFLLPESANTLWIVKDGAFLTPTKIEIDQPSQLAASRRQTDYFMIAHPSLISAIEPLATFHRKRGLSVEVIDVYDIYDEFNYSIEHPRAIRDFLKYVYHHRRLPRPRFVLLVGDASWYTKRHPDLFSTQGKMNQRNLIPTWQFFTREGPAASDNPFVTLSGDDHHPEMAVGRFPVTEPEEVSTIVAKTIHYMESTAVGPWRRQVLLISDKTRNQSALSEHLAKRLWNTALVAQQFLPADGNSSEEHQTMLRRAFDQGQLLVHFYGHGGRYMWQTAPGNLQDATNLFDLDDLDQLKPNTRWPVVLSMTCSTGPFDHPAADSLGEKFLRLPDRGAVAVLAASARNRPTVRFSDVLMGELVKPGFLGEAIVTAKNATGPIHPAALYNLLGDPALTLALPELDLTLVTKRSREEVEAAIDTGHFDGFALIDWLGANHEAIKSEQITIDTPRFVIAIPHLSDAPARQVRIYVWDPEQKIDGMGTIPLP